MFTVYEIERVGSRYRVGGLDVYESGLLEPGKFHVMPPGLMRDRPCVITYSARALVRRLRRHLARKGVRGRRSARAVMIHNDRRRSDPWVEAFNETRRRVPVERSHAAAEPPRP